ncbi:hypothetical protein N0O92_06540 [Alkalihalobacillus sp. MEB130]|nr:hypothetical protein [Alkalihalobacillus sp. MEB130]MDT8859885.1 hypothetical protein [Alkalihalobacillus sp. MEB130]
MKIISWYAHKETKHEKKEDSKISTKVNLKDLFKAKKNDQAE